MTTTLDPVPACELGRDVLQRFAAGASRGAERRSVLEHLLRGCSSCRQHFHGIQTLDGNSARPADDARQVTELLATLGEKATKIEREREEATALMAAFRQHPVRRQWTLIRNSARYDTWQFAAKLIDYSFETIYDDPRTAMELAEMALTVSRRLTPDVYGERLIEDVIARAQAHLGNAQRALGRLSEAESTLRVAREGMHAGTGDPLLEAEILYFEASMARSRRQFERALSKIRSAQSLYHELGDHHLEGLAVLAEGTIHLVQGNPERALHCYRLSLPMIQRERDPHLALGVRHNIVWSLLECGEQDEALADLASFRSEYERIGDRSLLAKLSWFEGKMYRKIGRLDDAQRSLTSAMRAFATLELPYEVAMASLDLASVLADRQRFGEMRRLAADTLVLFRSLGVERESIAAWLTFQRAVEAETVTAALIQRLAAFYNDAKNQPGISFSG